MSGEFDVEGDALLQVGQAEFVRDTVERARASVPAGEVLRADQVINLAVRASSPGYLRRPRVLASEGRALGSWLLIPFAWLLRIVTASLSPFERLTEAFTEREERKPGKPFHGGWNIMAGHPARAWSLGRRTRRTPRSWPRW
ncbi:hypothetical protein ABZ869_12365 [Streptomyces sp. NPDC046928]|uniref:hypothetical protein n=1 Tax=Streptomyces sp. NPDC046928 TaxID=3155021 RepID=UPI00340C75FE